MKKNKFGILLFRIKLLKIITVAGFLSFFLPVMTIQIREKTVFPAGEGYTFKKSLLYYSIENGLSGSIIGRENRIKISGFHFPMFLWKIASDKKFADISSAGWGDFNKTASVLYFLYTFILPVFTIILIKTIFNRVLRICFGWLIMTALAVQTLIPVFYNMKVSPLDFYLEYGFALNLAVYFAYAFILLTMDTPKLGKPQ